MEIGGGEVGRGEGGATEESQVLELVGGRNGRKGFGGKETRGEEKDEREGEKEGE